MIKNNQAKMGRILEFETIFPNDKPKTIGEYLLGGSKSVILNVASYFLGFKTHDSEFDDNKKLLGVCRTTHSHF